MKKTLLIMFALFSALGFCCRAYSGQRDKVDPCYFISSDGWRFRYVKQLNPVEAQEKVDMLRAMGMSGAVPAIFQMILNTQDKCDWLRCSIIVPEDMLLIVGPTTRAVFVRESTQVTSLKLIFADRSGAQYWDSQDGEIPLGASQDINLFSIPPRKIALPDGTKIRAIAYVCFVLVPYGSHLEKDTLKEVMVTGIRVEDPKLSLPKRGEGK